MEIPKLTNCIVCGASLVKWKTSVGVYDCAGVCGPAFQYYIDRHVRFKFKRSGIVLNIGRDWFYYYTNYDDDYPISYDNCEPLEYLGVSSLSDVKGIEAAIETIALFD